MVSEEIKLHRKSCVYKSVTPETEGLSPHSLQLATDPYLKPAESNAHPQPISLRSIMIPSSHLRLGLPSGLFPTKTFVRNTLYNTWDDP
jgi:hypothetical protein